MQPLAPLGDAWRHLIDVACGQPWYLCPIYLCSAAAAATAASQPLARPRKNTMARERRQSAPSERHFAPQMALQAPSTWTQLAGTHHFCAPPKSIRSLPNSIATSARS